MQPDQHVVPALVPLLQGRILYSLSRAHLPCHSCSRVRRIGGATDRVERPRLPVSHQQPTRGTGQDVCSLKTAALAQQQETTGHQRSLHLRVLQTWHPNRKAQQQQRRVINSAGVDAAGGASRANSPVPRHVVRLGYQQSLRPCQGGLTLNMDTAASAFLAEQPVLDFLLRMLGCRDQSQLLRMDATFYRKANKAIQSVKVEVRHGHGGGNKRGYKVKGLTENAADNCYFENDAEGKRMSVADYFTQSYGIKLAHPQLPCLNVGRATKVIWMPLELCHIAKGQRRLKLSPDEQAMMADKAAQAPRDRAAWVESSFRDSKLQTDPAAKAWGLQIQPNMSLVDARVLNPPQLFYKDRGNKPMAMRVSNGAWNLRDVRLHRGRPLTSFAIVSFDNPRFVSRQDPEGLEGFMWDQLLKLNEMAVPVPLAGNDPIMPEISFADTRSEFVGEAIQRGITAAKATFKLDAKAKPDLIFVNLPNKGAELYQEVKRASDSFFGIPSQCFVSSNAGINNPGKMRGRLQYCANVALKVNAKLGGCNVIMDPQRMPSFTTKQDFMLFGADVTHPLGFSHSEPSVAALVGSLDKECSQFASRVWLQGHRIEMLQGLKTHMRLLLLEHYRKSGKQKPQALVWYRDGVSEGQFPECSRVEVTQILDCCRELGQQAGEVYQPKLLFCVVQKRHHTRLFAANERDADKTGNLPAGTVLDHTATHPTENSFFLISHAGLKGTSRPTHYHVLFDTLGMPLDEFQQFTNNLCYIYARCTRSVSVCPPAYYAHRAAFRGRAMMQYSDSSASETSGTSGISGRDVRVEMASIHKDLISTMFYV